MTLARIPESGSRLRLFAIIMALAALMGMAGVQAQLRGESAPFTGVVETRADPFDEIVDENGNIKLSDASKEEQQKTLANVVSQYRTIASVITGILAVTMFIFMLIQFSKLGAAGDNEQSRKRAIGGILTTGIATALLGGASVIIGFFWNILAAV